MSDYKKPTLPTRQEILPPDRASRQFNVPVIPPDQTTGIIDSKVSGWVASIQARSIDRHTDLRKSQRANIEASTALALALKQNLIAWDDLYHIEQILDDRACQRAFDALVRELQAKIEIQRLNNERRELEVKARTIDREDWLQEQEFARDKQNATSRAEQQRWINRGAEEDARAQYLAKLRDRLMVETISKTVIDTRNELEKATNTEAKAKLSRALGILTKIARDTQPQFKTTDNTALRKLAESFKHKMMLAKDRHNNEEYGIYAQALAEVEEQLFQK